MARSRVPPSGIYTPLVTFYNKDESLDLPSIEKHALRISAGNTAGLVLQGSNGEAVHLDNDERTTIIRRVRSVLDANGFQNVTLIAGAGAPSKIATLILAREAKEAGAEFVLVLPPSYWAAAMTRPVLVKYFRAVADESPLPVLVYNFPLVSNGLNIDSDTMIDLAQHPNIVGCKLTDGNIGNLHRVAAHTDPSNFSVMSGKGEFALHGFVAGASGCIAALVNLAPKAHVAVHTRISAGDLKGAKAVQDVLADADLAQQKLGVAGLKLAVSHYFGYGSGRARSPLVDGDEAKLVANEGVLKRLVELENSL